MGEDEEYQEVIQETFTFSYADKFDIEDIEENRHLYLNGKVDSDAIGQIVYHILRYNRIDKGIPVQDRKPIVLYINTPGGNVVDGYSIVDAILSSKTPVYTVNLGECSSMGSIIFIVGHKRFAMQHSEFLIHEGSVCCIDNTSKAKELIDFEAGDISDMTRELILSKTKISRWMYAKKYKTEWYFLPKEAKKLGVVDYIIGTDCDLEEII